MSEAAYDGTTTYAQQRHSSSAERAQKLATLYDQSDSDSVRIVERLRSWRRHYADELNVPPYVIFGDKTLADIASRKPQTQAELLDCYGIGEMKAEKFGAAVLRIIRNEE